MKLVESVDGTPDIGDFVFEKAASEGEDSMDNLCELEDKRIE